MNEPTQQPRKKVGLACGGGFIRVAAQIGVLEVLQENNIPVDMIAGCSAGAAIAGAYAAGNLHPAKVRLSNGRRRDFWEVIFEPVMPVQGFLKGERNRKFFEEFVGDKTFADMQTPLILVATDLRSLREVIINEGPVAKAIQACTSVPGVFVPVPWGERLLADGGNFNLLPTKPLYEAGIDYVIAVDTSQPPNPATRTMSKIKQFLNIQPVAEVRDSSGQKANLKIYNIIGRAFSLSSSYIQNFQASSYRCNLLIRPDLLDVKRWHVSKVDYLVEKGRQATLAALPQIKKDLGL